jgi:hypothetical protein
VELKGIGRGTRAEHKAERSRNRSRKCMVVHGLLIEIGTCLLSGRTVLCGEHICTAADTLSVDEHVISVHIMHRSVAAQQENKISLYLSTHLYIYLSAYLSIHPSICLFIYLSIYPPIYLSIYLLIYLSTHLSIYLSTYLSIHPSMYLSTYLSIYLIYLSTCLSIYLSTHLFTYIYPLSI